MDTNDLAAFVAIADFSGFARAADRLGTTQSVVSKRLMRLESLLGARLVDRSVRSKIRLTRAGELYLPEARKILDASEQALRIGRNIARGEVGPLRIGYVFSAIMSGVLTDLLVRLQQSLPALEIEPSLLETPEQLRALAEGRLDVGLLRPRLSYPDGTTARIVHRESLIVGMADAHPLSGQAQIECRDLAGENLIIPQFHEEVGLIDAIRWIAAQGGFAVPEPIKTGDFVTAVAFAAAGKGIAVAPSSLQRLLLPGLRYRPLSETGFAVELAIVCRADMPPRAFEVLSGS